MIEAKSLKTERLQAARGIVAPRPEFTWTLAADRDGERQTACEIEVDRLAPGGGATPVWRSGKLSQLIGDEVRYGGEPLVSRTDYRWRVRVWPALSGVEANPDDQVAPGAPGLPSKPAWWHRTRSRGNGSPAVAPCGGS